MKPTTPPNSQLLPNRSILSKINAVVRKKSHEKNVQIPAEWSDSTSQAYRLLVGPRITEHLPKSDNSPDSEDQIQDIDEKSQSQKQFIQKLRPSRIKDQPPPINRSDVSFDALHFPPDLLVQCFPPDTFKKFDLIDRSFKKKQHRIVKPTVKSLNISQVNAPLFQSPPSSNQSVRSTERSENFVSNKLESEREISDEPPKDDETDGQNDQNDQIPIQPQLQDAKYYDNILTKFSARQRLRNVTKLRMYFYVLRCWAHYKINLRIKAAFIMDVHRTQVEIHNFNAWHKYVVKINRLRRCRSVCEQNIIARITRSCFLNWKTKSSKAIHNAEIARDVLVIFNSRLLEKVFPLFIEATRSRRICRREIQNSYRYKSEGPFTPINAFYTRKRSSTIKALHFNFVKKVPPLIRQWISLVHQTHKDNETSEKVFDIKKRHFFNVWFESYRYHFHMRQITEIRKISLQKLAKLDQLEKEASENIEKTVMMQLIRDRNVLNVKLNQFDRLSQNHSEAVLRRSRMKGQISDTTNSFFRRQEELQLIDFNRQANEIQRKTREVRIQLAEGFLYHLRRAVRSYDNQVIASIFCIGFRTICDPVVQKAVGYFYEKRHVKNLVKTANKERKTLVSAVKCSLLFHQYRGLELWRKFMKKNTDQRTEGLMAVIRRRTQILQMFPYFNWTEVLPVRPPRPLKEVETMFKDLPLVSIQRKLTKERLHHVNVKLMLMRRRLLRDFLRAFASYVQTQIATREVMKLLRKKQNIRLMQSVFNALRSNVDPDAEITPNNNRIIEINSNIIAWERHFFRDRNKQTQIVNQIPYS